MFRERLVDSVWARGFVVDGGKEDIPGPPTEYCKGGANDGDPSFGVVLEDTMDVSIR